MWHEPDKAPNWPKDIETALWKFYGIRIDDSKIEKGWESPRRIIDIGRLFKTKYMWEKGAKGELREYKDAVAELERFKEYRDTLLKENNPRGEWVGTIYYKSMVLGFRAADLNRPIRKEIADIEEKRRTANPYFEKGIEYTTRGVVAIVCYKTAQAALRGSDFEIDLGIMKIHSSDLDAIIGGIGFIATGGLQRLWDDYKKRSLELRLQEDIRRIYVEQLKAGCLEFRKYFPDAIVMDIDTIHRQHKVYKAGRRAIFKR